MKRIEPPLNNKGNTQHIYYNEEWNPRKTIDDDSSHEDFVDTFHPPKVDTTYYDDYEDYGN